MTDEARNASEETYRRDQQHSGDVSGDDSAASAAPPAEEKSAATTGVGTVADQRDTEAPSGEAAPYTLRPGEHLDDTEKRSDSGV